MANTAAPRPKRPPSPRARLRAKQRRVTPRETPRETRREAPREAKKLPRRVTEPTTESLRARTAFDGTQHASVRARRIYEGGVECAEGLTEFIDGYPLAIDERASRAVLTRLYNGAAEYLGWCLDTGRMPRVHTLPLEDSFE